MTSAALKKLDFLLTTNPQADIAGVVVRINNQIATVTREGRVQWFEQDGLGGIKRDVEADPRSPVEAFNAMKQRHNKE